MTTEKDGHRSDLSSVRRQERGVEMNKRREVTQKNIASYTMLV